MNLNRIDIIGPLTKNPDIKRIDGKKVANLEVETSYWWRDNKTNEKITETEYHTIVCWDKLADAAERLAIKGSIVWVEGRVRTRTTDHGKVTEIAPNKLLVLTNKIEP